MAPALEQTLDWRAEDSRDSNAIVVGFNLAWKGIAFENEELVRRG